MGQAQVEASRIGRGADIIGPQHHVVLGECLPQLVRVDAPAAVGVQCLEEVTDAQLSLLHHGEHAVERGLAPVHNAVQA